MERISKSWTELHRRSSILALTGLLHFLLIFVTGVLILLDATTVLGLNAWVKPLKFMVSITIYLWTVAWLIGHIEGRKWPVRVIAWGVSLAMVVETVCLFIQASRGTTSHYNTATAFDGAVFAMMGTMIAIDTVLMVGLLLLFLPRIQSLSVPYQWGIRLGILVFLFGGYVGGQMITNMAHTVGAADGGPGLPFLNWSTQAGDLRIAHALGLHALQILPLVGFWLGSKQERPLRWMFSAAAIYVVVMAGAFLQAKAGSPILAL
ncbi:MAG: hypothetical protein ACR2QM_19880 [Longimicrobiales bacterium]